MKSLASILGNKSLASPLLRGVSAALTIEAANEFLATLFGAAIKDHASAAYIKSGVLSIACLGSTVAQEIKLREKQIIQKINEKMGFTAVKKIKYLS
ncbi:MAG: hypothetical protein A2754_00250 [Candidatus Magasanikbacteria bacterium RIFCSPHIGHO2_01_FULL_47_8]|uniref:DUF721 domain-containing protein n=1 Tax=Candidatus Magasanikbacteria bacterium RIFCSPHIGHO2_01_FULL_47_8 TaxID=1798673 RepID=A0A1F6MFA3_9BACT|nr:MAG: hypothetical protein A2754_00250 [Candidatus Magasanikbacteria bacterium RIFCSPHIGHO2_01_FULL_47_8]